jgi:hypothetical protein
MRAMLVSLLILAGCATAAEQLTPVPASATLIGKWKGDWGGNMTHPMSGTTGTRPDGSVWVYLNVGRVEFPLKVLSDKRLEGTGRSATHQGPVILSRE